MYTKIALTLVAVILVLVPLIGIKASQIITMIDAGENFVPPPEAVEIDQVRAENWNTELVAVGTITAVKEVAVTTENPGIIRSIQFSSGDQVKAGQVLVRLDTSIEQAQLQNAIAAANLAKVNLERSQSLRDRDFASKASLDQSKASAQQSDAQVAQARAAIDRRTIRAPFAGHVGIRQVNPGQYLNAGASVVE
ncbi:MAG: efflux RND transporter periplasmic adaptor subunit, partial [Myxococcota bacterium]